MEHLQITINEALHKQNTFLTGYFTGASKWNMTVFGRAKLNMGTESDVLFRNAIFKCRNFGKN